MVAVSQVFNVALEYLQAQGSLARDKSPNVGTGAAIQQMKKNIEPFSQKSSHLRLRVQRAKMKGRLRTG